MVIHGGTYFDVDLVLLVGVHSGERAALGRGCIRDDAILGRASVTQGFSRLCDLVPFFREWGEIILEMPEVGVE